MERKTMEELPLNLEGLDWILFEKVKESSLHEKVLTLEQLFSKYPENDVIKFKLANVYGLLFEFEEAIKLLCDLKTKYPEDQIVQQLLQNLEYSQREMITKGEEFLKKIYAKPEETSFMFSTISELTEDFIFSRQFDRNEEELREKWMIIKADQKRKEIYLRSWSIETGGVESLYDFTEGTAKIYLEMGFMSNIFSHKDKINRCVNATPEELLKEQKEVVDYLLKNGGIKLTRKLITDLHEKFISPARFTMIQFNPFHKEVSLIRKGKFRMVPNIVQETDNKYYVYCPPNKVEDEIAKLLELYEKYQKQGCSPLILSAWLHHKFIQIHPFQDGNGRVCRAIASLILIEKSLPPVIIYKKNRLDYYEALRVANENDDLVPLIMCMLENYQEAFQVVNKHYQ